MRSLDDVHAVIAFFEARHGRLHGFRWKDLADFKSCAPLQSPAATDQSVGIGDGIATTFALVKRYASGAEAYDRPIRKPVAGTVLVAVADVPHVAGTDFTLDAATGIVTFVTPPAVGASITAGFEFDVPVRFDTDFLEINVAAFRAGDVPNIPIIELRLP